MFYILYSDKTIDYTPEINNYTGDVTIPFKKGYFLFDPNKQPDYTCWVLRETIVYESTSYIINKKLMFDNIIRAEINFLILKIEESIKSSFDFFMPKTFCKYINRFNELKDKYPEYVL